MENLTFVQPVTIKLYVKRDGSSVSRPYTTLHILTAKGLISALQDYKLVRVVYNSGKTDVRHIVYAHKLFAEDYAIVKF